MAFDVSGSNMTMRQLPLESVVADQYRITERLGEGGYGTVYRATDLTSGEIVAIKFLADVEYLRRFEVEAEVLRRLEHPGCLRILDAGRHEGRHFVVTEFVEGGSLREWLENTRPSTTDRLGLALQVARALRHAHAAGVLHRDLKPDNILVAADGTVRVADFGLAKLAGPRQPDITATGEVIGTPGFMSPEQLRGLKNVGPASDMYCLGVMLYEMLEEAPPFTGDSAFAICMKHLKEEPRTMRAVEADVARFVALLMQKDPADRPSAHAAVVALERLLGLPHSQRVQRPARRGGTSLAVLALGGLLVGVIAAGVVLYLFNDTPPPRRRLLIPPKPPPQAAVKGAFAVDEAAQDLGQPPPAIAASPGCGEPLEPGRRRLSVLVELNRVQMEGVVPADYDARTPHPLFIVLHEGKQSPGEVLSEFDMQTVADELGAVVLAPDGHRLFQGSWKTDPIQIVTSARTFGLAAACVDPERVFLIGHGVGSDAAISASCATTYAGVVITNRLVAPGDSLCEPETPTPTLWLTARRDFAVPSTCMHPPEVDFEGLEDKLRQRNACDGAADKREMEHGVCRDHQCDAPLTTCRVAGGVHLTRGGGGAESECDGPGSPFDYRSEIVRFLRPLTERRSP